jgi:hypothetical protein
MHGAKVLLVVVFVGLLAAAGTFTFVPSTRPNFVKKWFRTASGFTPAKTPEDALDKFKRALEKRDFETASLYCSGDYKEWIEKGKDDAKMLATAIDDLRHAMKMNGVKSDLAEYVLLFLEPFPANFKVTGVKKSSSEDKAVARLDWREELSSHEGGFNAGATWKVDNRIWNSLLPRVITNDPIDVALVQEKDGTWTIQIPVQSGERHLRHTVEYLRKNGSNFKNALNELKSDVKNSAPTKENFESSLRVKLEESK